MWRVFLLSGLLACAERSSGRVPVVVASSPEPFVVDVESVHIEPDERARVRHILFSWAGALRASPNLRRTRAEAWTEAVQAMERLDAGEDFGDLAEQLSDDSSGERNGEIGAIESGETHLVFESMAFSLEEGERSPIIETPFGFHILLREPLVEIRIRQILVQWEDSRASEVERSQEEAFIRVEQARAQVLSGIGVDVVAREFSDGPLGFRGGDLGHFEPGQMLPRYEAIAFELEVGELSEIIESELGYHLLYRDE